MKLIELNPRWYRQFSDGPISGITFICPHCYLDKKQRLAILFQPTFDDESLAKFGIPWPHPAIPGPYWKRTGNDFETITLEPSINAGAVGHWHGSIVNGEIR